MVRSLWDRNERLRRGGGGSVWDLEIPHGTVGDIGRGEEDEHA